MYIGIAAYFVSSLGAVAVVKFLNYEYCLSSYVLFALLSRSTWVLSLPLHLILECREGVRLKFTCRQVRLYFVVALGLSAVEILNSLSMSVLPGSWYALIKGTDVGWSMALSCLILRKTYPKMQVAAAVLIMGGVAGACLVRGGPAPSTAHVHAAEVASRDAHVGQAAAGLICALGALVNALCSVGTEAVLKTALKEEEERQLAGLSSEASPPSKLLHSNAQSMWTTLISFGILVVPAALGGKLQTLPSIDALCDAFVNDDELSTQEEKHEQTPSLVAVVACLVAVGVARFAERLSKYWICVCDSAMTFSVVQALRRLSGVYVLAFFLREGLPPSMIVGSACSGIGFVLHWYGGLERTSTGGARYELVTMSSDALPTGRSSLSVDRGYGSFGFRRDSASDAINEGEDTASKQHINTVKQHSHES